MVNRVSALLKLLHLLAFAILTVVCAGLASDGRDIASLATRTEVTALRGGDTAAWALANQPVHQWQDGAASVVRDALEAEDLDDDDGDARFHDRVDEGRAFTRVGSARGAGRALREALSDPSRFAMGRGLPRGPPV